MGSADDSVAIIERLGAPTTENDAQDRSYALSVKEPHQVAAWVWSYRGYAAGARVVVRESPVPEPGAQVRLGVPDKGVRPAIVVFVNDIGLGPAYRMLVGSSTPCSASSR